MGSGSSKDASSSSSLSSSSLSSSSCRGRRGRKVGRARAARVFSSSCFGLPPTLADDQIKKEGQNGRSELATCIVKVDCKAHGVNCEGSEKLASSSSSSEIPGLTSSRVDLNEEGRRESTSNNNAAAGESSSNSSSTAAANNRARSRFSLIPDSVSFRLNRAVSLGSSVAHNLFPGGGGVSVPARDRDTTIQDQEEHFHVNILDGTGAQENNTIQATVSTSINGISDSDSGTRAQSNVVELDEAGAGTGHSYRRRIGNQEMLEGSVRFSRTLSVGRLRDRVLRRTSPFSAGGLFSPALLDERAALFAARRTLSGTRRVASFSNRIPVADPDSSSSANDPVYETTAAASPNGGGPDPISSEASNHDLLERRSAFLERRRRIRSQVRALQRLGSRFENLSGHERSCILSGRHRTDRCTCRVRTRSGNSDDETGTRSSISRIVMLAEALFEVLDEIHQQSVVLSSRPSLSSSSSTIGSVPAPKEVVECLPVKMYSSNRPSKLSDEPAQCYICLVEYEEGDTMRVLPCNHEFHLSCIDKWLKDIHRVCPLCRGDVCRRDASSCMAKLS